METTENRTLFRFVIRFTNKKVILQLIDSNGPSDITMIQVLSTDLKHFGILCGHSNIPCAYLSGLYFAKLIRLYYQIPDLVTPSEFPFALFIDIDKKKSKESQIIKAILRGATEGGIIDFEENLGTIEDCFVFGEILSSFMVNSANNQPEIYAKQFSQYIANNIDPTTLPDLYHQVHDSILSLTSIPPFYGIRMKRDSK